jgi:hypothetical protein
MSQNQTVPCLRIQDGNYEYLTFLDTDGQIETIVKFKFGSRIGTTMKLAEVPWSVRWQIEKELSNFSPT